MNQSAEILASISAASREQFRKHKVILSFDAYLDTLAERPVQHMRHAAAYLDDMFQSFGTRDVHDGGRVWVRPCVFDAISERHVPIVGGERVQHELRNIVRRFVLHGFSDKMILMHGPNGSAKTSTVEAVASGMQRYSETDAGAVYRFNWVFPTARTGDAGMKGEPSRIGFGGSRDGNDFRAASFATLDETQIAAKIPSEFKENPIYLIPMPERESLLRRAVAAKTGQREDDVAIPAHILVPGLSKRNQTILENLLAAYDGDYAKVLRHVQVERFYFSRQYRVGISTVEPQMSVDAAERQLTMDRSIANLPAVLHNVSLHEASGELVEANRGILEFSDLLKRPVEAFKYLLSTVERSRVNLPSQTALLDVVFFATTNEKHLDAFKTIPDFSSFRERFELVTVPYLLRASQEEKIYAHDIATLSKTTPVAPHSLRMLCVWAVMTRLKAPDPENYDAALRPLVARLDPRSKLRLYEGDPLGAAFKPEEEALLREARGKVLEESWGLVVYEGRFGASPREVRAILERAAQHSRHPTLTPMAIFDELERLVRDRTIYEFLQFEPRGKYHDAVHFIGVIREEFARIFENEVTRSMNLVEEGQYESLLTRYIDHVVASIRKERIYNSKTTGYEEPSRAVLGDVEKILGVTGDVEKYREGLLRRIAAHKIDHPQDAIHVPTIFQDLLEAIQRHYFGERAAMVDQNHRAMLALGTDEERSLSAKDRDLAETTFATLQSRFGYDRVSAKECLKFMMGVQKKAKKAS